MYQAFRSRLQQNVDRFYEKSVKMFDWWKKIAGTDVIIIRPKKDSRYKDFFGAMFTSDSVASTESEELPAKLMLVHNEMYEVWTGGIQSTQVVDREHVLERGDLIRYTVNNQILMFKVVEERAFGDSFSIWREYTIESTKEINN